jgi:8-oxo-dGTP pyrophosphatase MutT (NUDIX family)
MPEGGFAAFENRLRTALALELPYDERMPLREGTPAAVLILFGRDRSGAPSLLMTKRTETVETHKGQMAFPGGMSEPQEASDSEHGSERTALRETEEEIGIPLDRLRPIGRLPLLWTITNFLITPIVGVLDLPIEEVPLRPNAAEIAEAFWIGWETLSEGTVYRREAIERGAIRYPIHVYQVGDYRIWGATGSMLKNLMDRFAKLSFAR